MILTTDASGSWISTRRLFALFATCGGCSNVVGAPVPDQPNMPPTARVDDARARVGELVELSAEGSADPDGDALSFAWTLRRAPDDSVAALDVDGIVARFVPDRVGLYALDLIVSDGELSSAPATAIVQVEGYAAPRWRMRGSTRRS
jgi:hypothetical protein